MGALSETPTIQSDAVQIGDGAATWDASSTSFELSHPLDSGDPDDFDVAGAAGVGVCLQVSSSLTSASAASSYPADCILFINQQETYAEIVLP